ncbi:hypothetical protein U9M48_015221 [Paspalum notatum var. saurae]|uniref:KIB1-4 beta-propeller domain-containing protein n=1 Tax=Paspalum notatum var. saurae TaxID=547442 RepID=A0AAQ3WLI8_PASNO
MAEAVPRARQPPSWADLPLDLAGTVLRFLPAYVDRTSFAAVCPQWRAATQYLPLPPPLPLLALPNGTFYSLPYGKPFRFPGYKTACCGSWLVFPRDDGCFLVNPFSGATVTLPALSRVRLRPPNAVARTYPTWMDIMEPKKMPILNKLILCSPNLVAAFAGSPHLGAGHISQILMCQPGASSWSVRAYDKCKLFEDMAFFRGKLYALAADENLLIVNISQDPITGDPQISRIGQVIKGDPCYPNLFSSKKKLYLIESSDTLLMVRRKVYCKTAGGLFVAGKNEFEVFEADLERSQWVTVTTLGEDQMLFLGQPSSRAVSASQYGMQNDQILFLDDIMVNHMDYSYVEEITSVSAYDMRTGKVSSPLPMVWNHEMLHVTWLFP